MASTSGPQSQTAESEVASQPGEELLVATEQESVPMVEAFPPYPPYAVPPAPPSVADTIIAGRDLRLKHKSTLKKPAHPPPRPAGPRTPKATDVKLSRRAQKAHARCLRCHGTVLTDRLERISKPQRRKIIYLWREYAKLFPAETVARLRSMLDADEPFNPDQAYEYFVNLKKGKKKNATNAGVNQIKKDILSMYGEKRFLWARNATVAFARGIQQRLAKSGRYALCDGMLRLSNIILDEICGYMHMKTPSRRNDRPKEKFMIELSDKIAVWIDEILTESDDRMLMMDFDEDEGPPAYLKFKGPMLDAFNILTDSMQQRNGDQLITHGKFSQTYAEAANELKTTEEWGSTDFSSFLANDINGKLIETSKPKTPSELVPYMNDVVDICSKHLSQNAEYNKHKGPAFKLLVETMKKNPNEKLFQKDKIEKTYGQAAKELEAAKDLETNHEDPALADQINTKLRNTMEGVTPDDLKTHMEDTMDIASKYMSEKAVDELERGPAFDILIKQLERDGAKPFYDSEHLATQSAAANILKSAPGLTNVTPEPKTAPIFSDLLHKVVDAATPGNLKEDMNGVIERCANYLSAIDRDGPPPAYLKFKGPMRDAFNILTDSMQERKGEQLITHEKFSQSYAEGADELKTTPEWGSTDVNVTLANDINDKLIKTSKPKTSSELEPYMNDVVDICSKHLSQNAEYNKHKGPAFKLLVETMKKKPNDKLFQKDKIEKTYGQAAKELEAAKGLGTNHEDPTLADQINTKLRNTMEGVTPNDLKTDMEDTMDMASKYVSQKAVDELERGPAFDILIKELERDGAKPFYDSAHLATQSAAANTLKSAPGLTSAKPDPKTAPIFSDLLHKVVDAATPVDLKQDMNGVIERCANYLSAFELNGGKHPGGMMKEKQKIPSAQLQGYDGGAKGEGQKRDIETEAQRKARLEAEKERLAREAEERRKRADEEQEAALQLLTKELKRRGDEVFYEQSHTTLTHKQAAECLSTPPSDTDKKMKGISKTSQLHKKFEKKLDGIVAPVTPSELSDAMQDVVIESAQQLSDKFIASNYKAQAGVALISEMQKHGNEILVEVDGKTETSFFAAQRLKKAKELTTDVPCTEVAPRLNKRLDEMMRQHPMPLKITPTVKEHTKEAANFLSPVVTKPEPYIEAYVALLEEMEATGEKPLIEGDISKTHKEAASHLRQLTSFEDKINLPNASLQNNITGKLNNLMGDVAPVGYTKSTMNDVIKDTAGLLTSHTMNEGNRTEALKAMVKLMDEAGNNLLLRHGSVRKSFTDGADLLRDKNTDQLRVVGADPVVARKVEIKLNNLMQYQTPQKYVTIMNGVIKDATQYLGVHLLEPQVIKICKCMKTVFVQCEMWCDETLRRMAKPPCTCSRHISAQDVQDLGPATHLQICPGTSRVGPPGVEIAITECPSKQHAPEKIPCPASKSKSECGGNPTFYYMLHSTVYRRKYDDDDERPTRIPPQTSCTSKLSSESAPSITYSPNTDRSFAAKNLIRDLYLENMHLIDKDQSGSSQEIMSDFSYKTHQSRSRTRERPALPSQHAPTIMFNKVYSQDSNYPTSLSSSLDGEVSKSTPAKNRNSYSSRAPIVMVSTDQMADWHAMMVNLMWNVQAWRKWFQENIDRGLTYQYNSDSTPREAKDSWTVFYRRVSTEALQWRQYNIFSRRLITRLVSRYCDTVILSPTRHTVKTDSYDEIARDMSSIISMFAKWTQWLILVMNETNSTQHSPDSTIPLHAMCWYRYKNNISEYAEDWNKYNSYLNTHWEQKYRSFIANCAPTLSESGPVWVVSTCGAVPSGAVAAGIYDGEIIWIARTTHRRKVLPAALHPSKHCCLVYTDGAVYPYTKYQVMCNADVNWLPWRGGAVSTRAVRVAKGEYIGRVHYRGSHIVGRVHAPHFHCHVVIFGRPFAFNCYELLVLAPAPSQQPTH